MCPIGSIHVRNVSDQQININESYHFHALTFKMTSRSSKKYVTTKNADFLLYTFKLMF